jgi:8-oxo-dGTP pyrophosphatase MutT (NUDIX family)
MQKYTLIFLFDSDGAVLLINKGFGTSKHYNGLGGKIEPHERYYVESACRELKEEANLDVNTEDLVPVGTMESEGYWWVTIFCGRYKKEMGDVVSSPEGEVEWVMFDHTTPSPFNLRWLVPLCWNTVTGVDAPHLSANYTPDKTETIETQQ